MKTRKKVRKNNGWMQVSFQGSPYEIGLQHGTLLKPQIQKIEPLLKYTKKNNYNEFMNRCKSLYLLWQSDLNWSFIYDEMRGISEASGTSIDIIFAWNMLLSLDSPEPRCSAFIWSDGSNIVMAHNTHSEFSTGFFGNVVAHIYPKTGYHFVMQTAPGLVSSSTDWFITSSGIIGCETTLKQTDEPVFDNDHVPYFFRIRKAMEQGTMMDDYVRIMSENNAGDYGCQWLLGNINTGHIMQFELTLNEKTVTMQTSGYFVGANMSSWNPEPLSSRNGARIARLQELIQNKSNIDVEYAKQVLADHYDMYLKKKCKGYRSICSHKEPNKNAGTVDGKVTNTALAKHMHFMGRMGSSCGDARRLKMTKREKSVTPIMKTYGWTKL